VAGAVLSDRIPCATVHRQPPVRTSEIGAVIFDMDGVVTDTAVVHAVAWKQLFDEFLQSRVGGVREFKPFDVDDDYLRYVDGKPRYDGVRSFLTSRNIVLPQGDPADPPDRDTICGLGNRKDRYFLTRLREEPALAYPSTTQVVRDLAARGVRTAIVSASRNMSEVLESAGLSELFEVRVDGVMADERHLPGKPDPAVFLEAARLLGVAPTRAAVVEDALAGVEAARRGGFALVVGVDRRGHGDALLRGGAHVVIRDVGELCIE
jgi:beta-phosphoglucomutase family hydrolase